MTAMDSNGLPTSSEPAPAASSVPAAKDLLRAISSVAPQLWFPLQHAELSGLPRDSLDEPLWHLRQAGMVQVADWIAGLGQGFQLTRDGERAIEHPDPLALADGVSHSVETPLPETAENPALPERAVRPTVVAPALLALNLVAFAVGAFLAWQAGSGAEYLKGERHAGSNHILLQIGAVSGSKLILGEWWRLITGCFVHVGLIHLLGNLLMLGILGPICEQLWGRRRFAIIYLAAGLAGNCLAMGVQPSLLAGASGALWGVMLSVMVWLYRHRDNWSDGVALKWARRLLLVIVINLLLSFAPEVNFEAHLGGGCAGVALALWFDRRFWPSRSLSLLFVVALTASMLGSLYLSTKYSDAWLPLRQIAERR